MINLRTIFYFAIILAETSTSIYSAQPDCGPRALSTVMKYYRVSVPVDSLSKYAGTMDKGTTLLGLVNAAKQCGFDAYGIQTDYAGLMKAPKPLIVHINNNHYTIVIGAFADSLFIEDGGRRLYQMRHTFLKTWSGNAMVVYPQPATVEKKFGPIKRRK